MAQRAVQRRLPLREEQPELSVSPRDYGTARWGRIFVAPSRYALGKTLNTPAAENYCRLMEWQAYNRRRLDADTYAQQFEEFLQMKPTKLRSRLLEAIRKEKETGKLWSERTESAIIDGNLEHQVLSGRVKSRRKAGAKVLGSWLASVKTPFYNEASGIDYSVVSCQCEDHQYGKMKRADFVCMHPAALLDRLHEEYPGLPPEQRLIEVVEPAGMPYVPFLIGPVTQMNVLIAHYLLGRKYFEIDKEMLDNPDIYDPLYLRAIQAGNITFEVLPQGPQKSRKDKGTLSAEGYVKRTVGDQLRRAGFRKVGIASLEFRDTKWETVCETYEKDGRAVRLVFNEGFPPLVVYRHEPSGREVFYAPDKEHPFAHLYEERETVDDRTRLRTTTVVAVPWSPKTIPGLPELRQANIVGNLHRQYAALIGENYQGDATSLMHELGFLL